MTPPPRHPRTSRTRSGKSKKVIAARPAVGRGRVGALIVSLTLIAAGFGWRLVDLQLMPDAALAADIGSQVRHEVIAAPRGEIVDRHGRPIALSLPRPSIVANPRLLQAEDLADGEADLLSETVDSLSRLLTTDVEVIRERLGRDKAFAYLERQVDPEVGDAVRALGLPGIYIEEEQGREHPLGCSALSVVGRVDSDQNGISGLELDYDEHLTGRPGEVVRQTQAGGQVQIPGGFQLLESMEPGAELALTLDRNVQFETEQILLDTVAGAEADLGIAVVGDPRTGEVLAMVNVQRDPETGDVACTTNNLAATRAFEPGSIMKPITFTSVFENDAWPEFYPIDIPHQLTIELADSERDFTYSDRNVPPEGAAHTPTWVLRKSSNIGTILMAQEVGADALYETMVRFGLGEVTALDLNGEASGILDPLDSHALELSNAAIGQGVAVTALQMFQAYSALGAGGQRIDPVLVMDEVGRRPPTRVASEETADAVVRMMRQVVIDGTGQSADIPGYHVAGKTGTAWQPCSGGTGYFCADGSRHLTASFAGLVGNDAGAALTIVVIVDNPHGERTGGGSVAAPAFADIAGYALRQLRIAPLSDVVSPNGRVRAVAASAVAAPVGEGADQEAP